jgi:hypothetical protein
VERFVINLQILRYSMLYRMFKPSVKEAKINKKTTEVRSKEYYTLMNLAVFLYCETDFIGAKQ